MQDPNPLMDTNQSTTDPNPLMESSVTSVNTQVKDPNPLMDTPTDVQSSEKQIGNPDYNGYCETFVEKMTGSPNMGSSAYQAWNNYTDQGKAQSGIQGIQKGDLIYFAPDQSNGWYGHTGIYTGNNHFISATYNGIKADSLNDWQKNTGQQILGFVRPSN